VRFQNSATGLDQGFYATRSYSLMRPGDMVIRADLLAAGAEGFARVLEGLLGAAR
jgi:hypothetical protein